MPPLFSTIRQLDPLNTHWALKLRLLRCYKQPVFQKETFGIECVFHDEEGSRIHGNIKKEEMIKRLMPILKEGQIFAIKNMVIVQNGMTYKTTQNEYKLIFSTDTNFCEVFDDTFPNFMFQFKPFSTLTIAGDVVDETTLFDVIGRLVAINSPQNKETNGRTRRLIDFVLEDTENNRLPCTLWGEFVDKMTNYLEKVDQEAIIVILQMCRAKPYKGEMRVSNVFHITNLIVNEDLKEVCEFRKGDRFYCKKCNRMDVTGNLRFKIHTRVVDHTGNAVFLLWDRECVTLIGKIAMDLRVDEKIHGFFGTYTVMKVIVDHSLMEKYCVETFESQESDVYSKLRSSEIEHTREICSSEDEVKTPQKTTTKAIISSDVLNDSTLKRSLIDEFSSTASGKKMKSTIKQEKD
ncbi:replication protein A 70 kDa DNA-binding subunit A-like [Henckelia pumila]|uniref:replication protein A 70 kDa DNA-binding subunit A-like n=1 Tax=Henckelia pumila TaxID=405737 RepID=UPI003C6DD193